MDADVCIVGAGAAGSIMALELGRRGMKVIVLEAGPWHDVATRGDQARRYLRGENPWRRVPDSLDHHTFAGRVPYGLEGRRVRGVGGSTLAWEGYAVRFHASDFRLRSRHGIADDWPIGYDDLEPFYARAEAALGVAGVADDPWASPRSAPFPLAAFPLSHSDGLFARAGATLGITLHHLPQARNSGAYDGRAQCRACSTCHVCPTGAKASTDLTHVPAAQATGNVRVITDATVLRLTVDRAGEVSTAVYAHADRVERGVTARAFVIAGGAVENARLLLLSKSAAFPDGLANTSGLVGKRFMSHPFIDVIGRTADRVHPYRIGFSTAMSRRFAVDRDRSARGAFLMEFLNSAGPKPGELALASGLTGASLRRYVGDEFGRRLGIRIFCEQLPDRANAVSVNPRVTDYFGSGVPHIVYNVGAYERAALDEARKLGVKILEAAGATYERSTAITPAAHQIGTHRMGHDPKTSVVDPELRAHDVPNLYLVGSGCFVTATASPPTLTIAALALRASGHLAARLGARRSGGGAPEPPRLVERAEHAERIDRLT